MTKKELIDQLNNQTGEGKATCETIIDALAKVTAKALAAGDQVTLPGIAKLSIQATKERTGKNPATGEVMTIPAGTRIKFKALKALKDAAL